MVSTVKTTHVQAEEIKIGLTPFMSECMAVRFLILILSIRSDGWTDVLVKRSITDTISSSKSMQIDRSARKLLGSNNENIRDHFEAPCHV